MKRLATKKKTNLQSNNTLTSSVTTVGTWRPKALKSNWSGKPEITTSDYCSMPKTHLLPMMNSNKIKTKNNSKMTTAKFQSILTRRVLPNGCAVNSSSLNSNQKLLASDSFKTMKRKESIDLDKESPALPILDPKCKV